MNKNKNKVEWINKKSINYDYTNKLIKQCELSGIFTNYGNNITLLENTLKKILKIDDDKCIIVVSNGSHALQILCNGISCYDNKKLYWNTQSFTFPSSIQGYLNDTKIVDIDNEGGLDLTQITPNINGIIVTNCFGNLVNINKYELWCKKNTKYLIFDNAATPYSFYNNKNSCNYGDGTIISLHHTKPIGFGEGGAIITDKKYEKTIRKLINFGEYKNNLIRYSNNFKMSEISAIFILQYLSNFESIVKHHMMIYNYIENKIKNIKNVSLLKSYHDKNNTFLPACICLLSENSNKIIEKIKSIGIFCKKYYIPLKNTNNAIKLYNKIICIPCNLDVKIKYIDNIIKIISSLNSSS